MTTITFKGLVLLMRKAEGGAYLRRWIEAQEPMELVLASLLATRGLKLLRAGISTDRFNAYCNAMIVYFQGGDPEPWLDPKRAIQSYAQHLVETAEALEVESLPFDLPVLRHRANFYRAAYLRLKDPEILGHLQDIRTRIQEIEDELNLHATPK